MGEYFGLFIFLGVFLMAFWILIFLVVFLGFWSVMGGLNSLMPGLFEKKGEAEAATEETAADPEA